MSIPLCVLVATPVCVSAAAATIVDEPFAQESRTAWVTEGGVPEIHRLPEAIVSVEAVAVAADGTVVASCVDRLENLAIIEYDGASWSLLAEPVSRHVGQSWAHAYVLEASGKTSFGPARDTETPPDEGQRIVCAAAHPQAGWVFATREEVWIRGLGDPATKTLLFKPQPPALSVAVSADGAVAVGTAAGLYVRPSGDGAFDAVFPDDGARSWAPKEVAAVAYDSRGRLWFGSRQGVGVFDGESWRLYTGEDGLPYGHFTCASAGEDGVIWFGTERGAIRFDGKHWAYRASLRWLPDDHVNDIAVEADGTAWIATPRGVSRIERTAMTLEEKAAHFVDQVESRHNRDGYTTTWRLTKRGEVSSAAPAITDNDGQYTSVYGAATAFRYAVTKDPEDRAIAQRSFEACKRLVDITPDSMKGFPARVLIPIDWPEPVNEQYGPEYNRRKRMADPFWKLITPRFVTSEDGQHLWKCDTSSDETVAHYFEYSVYYDLLAETDEDKAAVRQVVRDLTDHLIRNGFNLVDHDGKPTRWARFGPDYLDTVYGWEQRGLNSLLMLSALAVAEYVTGDPRYAETAQMLRDEHKYHINMMEARPFFPPGNIVPWDNLLALLAFYPLMQYEEDPELLILYRQSLEHCWQFVSRHKNPLYNVMYAASAQRFARLAEEGYFDGAFPEAGPYAKHAVAQLADAHFELEDTLDTLRGMPLELIGWRMQNSHRLDVEFDPMPGQDRTVGWSKVDRKALPIEERAHVRHDRDAMKIDAVEGDGWDEHEGSFFLLPYFMARYHGLIE